MRSDIVPGAVFPDYELPDHTATRHKLSERRAAAAHGEHEKRLGAADPNWPDWYTAYMVAEQTAKELPR